MDEIVTRKLFELKSHEQNDAIFGDPRTVPEYDEIKRSIRESGLQEPLIVKADGTILSGHLRFHALKDIAAERGQLSHEVDVIVRVHADFETSKQELTYLFEANIQRRQLSPRQIAHAYKAMLSTIESEPKPKRTRRKNGAGSSAGRRVNLKEKVARLFNVSVRNAESLAVIYQTAGVPADVLDLVDTKAISVKLAAEAVRYAMEEAKRRDSDGPIVVSPIDVHAYLNYPRGNSGTKIVDLLRGSKPQAEEPIVVDGMPVKGYYGPVETSNVPPPYVPKQTVRDMIVKGVSYSEKEYSDPGLPLHEVVTKMRARLADIFACAHNIQEAKVADALEPFIENIAHYLRSMGRNVTVILGGQEAKILPESLYERLVLLRVAVDEEDSSLDPAVLRTLLSDISRAAQERGSALRKSQRAIAPKAPLTQNPVPRKERPTFPSDIEFITHVVGPAVVDFLGSGP